MHPHPRPLRATIDLAILASGVAVVLAYVLNRFVGVGEAPIVLGTLAMASVVGWTQPAVRSRPRPCGRLTPVVVPVRRPHA